MQIEKSVFISYRHTNVYHARAIFQDLRANGYDVFLDSESIGPGDFERIILGQIKARAHFLVLLTPSALEDCHQPGDWLRREIETAIDEKRNIVPLMFEGSKFENFEGQLTGKLAMLKKYMGLNIYSDFFDAAMERLRNKYLNVALDVVLHPTPAADQNTVHKIVQNEAAQPTVTEQQLTASEYIERAKRATDAKDYDAAIQDYTEALQLDPTDAMIYLRRGLNYENIDNPTHAIIDYTEAVRLNPLNSRYYFIRAMAYESIGDFKRAIADYTEAIHLKPNSAYYYARGSAYGNTGKIDLAISDYTESIHASSSNIRSYLSRGDAYQEKGDYARARADYEAALRLDPEQKEARQNLRWLNKQGK